MKRKNTIVTICLMLAICLLTGSLLGACSSNGGGEKKTGRFTEQQIAELLGADKILDAKTLENGDAVFYSRVTKDGNSQITASTVSKDGSRITSDEVSWINELLAEGGYAISYSEGGDGNAYLLYSDSSGKNCLVRHKDGKLTPLEIDDWNKGQDDLQAGALEGIEMPQGALSSGGVVPSGEDEDTDSPVGELPDMDTDATSGELTGGNELSFSVGNSVGMSFSGMDMLFPSGIDVLENGDFLITYSGMGVYRYSPEGEKIMEYAGSSYSASAVFHNGRLALPDIESGNIIIYDLETGDMLESYPYNGDIYSVILSMDGEDIYASDSSGIYRFTGSGKESVVDGGLTSLMLPTYRINSFLAQEGGEYLCVLSDDDGSYVMRYYFDENLPSEPDRELNIFSLYDSNTVRQAIGEFQRKNPDVRVKLNVALAEDGSATQEDVIRALNTQLLSGNGPDLIVLDGLPIESYIEKGVLKDISELANRLITNGNLLENILSAYTRNGKTYALPSRFSLPVIMGENGVLNSISSLKELADMIEEQQGGDKKLLSTPDELWTEDLGVMMKYYDACSGSFIREDGRIDEEALAGFLTDMLRIDKALKDNSPQLGEGMTAVFAVAAAGSSGFEVMDLGSWSLSDGSARAHIQKLVGMMGLQNIGSNLGDDPDMILSSLFGENLFYPAAGIGITSSCKQEELASSFIETMLSESIQGKYLYDGFPVSASAMAKMLENHLGGEEPVSDMGFEELCSKLNTPVFVDEVVKAAVEAQIKGLLSGEISPERAAENVVEKTKIYLAE